MSNRFRHWFHQWSAMAPWERSVLALLSWQLPFVWVRLRLSGFKKTHYLIEADLKRAQVKPIPDGLPSIDFAQRCAQLAEIAARHGFYRANCLHQSLALCSILRKMGLQAQLRIGVLPGNDTLNAHAWVELDGISLGKPVSEYRVFSNLDSWNGLL